MFQSWERLLFLHWKFDPQVVQRTLPPGLYVDTFDGTAWVGVVPFFMRRIRPWWSPSIPGISNFLELNLRTYVHDDHGTPGVWFYTLDANQRLATWWGRRFFDLPYYASRMSASLDAAGHVSYSAHRRGLEARLASQFQYGPNGPERLAQPGSIEFFLVERYILFARRRDGGLFTGQVSHRPYPIHDARVSRWDDNVFDANGSILPRPARSFDHALYVRGVDVEVFGLQPVAPKIASTTTVSWQGERGASAP
jgi:uncharacterized protein YqjF (DUF2071 family)